MSHLSFSILSSECCSTNLEGTLKDENSLLSSLFERENITLCSDSKTKLYLQGGNTRERKYTDVHVIDIDSGYDRELLLDQKILARQGHTMNYFENLDRSSKTESFLYIFGGARSFLVPCSNEMISINTGKFKYK
eukprot:Awhi_evm1s471